MHKVIHDLLISAKMYDLEIRGFCLSFHLLITFTFTCSLYSICPCLLSQARVARSSWGIRSRNWRSRVRWQHRRIKRGAPPQYGSLGLCPPPPPKKEERIKVWKSRMPKWRPSRHRHTRRRGTAQQVTGCDPWRWTVPSQLSVPWQHKCSKCRST